MKKVFISSLILSAMLVSATQAQSMNSASSPATTAQDPAKKIEVEASSTSREAGQYERSSVSYINALWLLDESAKTLTTDQVSSILSKSKNAIIMPRFDQNPLPPSIVADFVAQANALQMPIPSDIASTASSFGGGSMGNALSNLSGGISTTGDSDPALDSLAAIMERTLVPKILEIVDAQKEMRAANLTTEQERNSFFANKAKSYGITMAEIEKVMNSAYIFLPVARNYKSSDDGKSISVGLDLGVIWFRISTKGEKARAILAVKKFTHSGGAAIKGRTFVTDEGALASEDFAYFSAVKNAVRNLLTATQEIPEFKLSSQVIEKDGGTVGFPMGKGEGLHVDDKFMITEFTEQADGSVVPKNNGWVMVNMVGDSTKPEGYKSKAQIISGDPYTGVVLTEYPRIPIDIVVKGKYYPFSTTKKNETTVLFDSLGLGGAFGFEAEAMYNLGRSFGLNQFWFDFGFGMGIGGASGSNHYGSSYPTGKTKISMASNINWEFSLLKKFYLGRIALDLQAGFGLQTVMVETEKYTLLSTIDSYNRFINSGAGIFFNGNVELPLTSWCNLGLGGGYQIYGASKDWTQEMKAGLTGDWSKGSTYTDAEISHSGPTVHLFLTISPPALPFDPLDLLRGSIGL